MTVFMIAKSFVPEKGVKAFAITFDLIESEAQEGGVVYVARVGGQG